MQFSQPFLNPVVPANYSFNEILLTSTNNNILLSYPQAFTPNLNYFAAYILVTNDDSISAGSIYFDDARLASNGTGTIVVNEGTSDLGIFSVNGLEILVLAPSQSYSIFLTDNTTADGEWQAVLLGATTSAANAAALAGLGLIAYNNKLNSTVPSIEENISITLSNDILSTLVNWTGGNYTFYLQNVFAPVPGFYFYIRNSSPSNGVLNIHVDTPGSIDGVQDIYLTLNQSCMIVYDANSQLWKTVGLGQLGVGSGVQLGSNGIKVVNGTATNPSYSFILQPTTGIYNPSNSIAFTVSGAQVASVNQNGFNLDSGSYFVGGDDILELTGIYP